MPGELTMLQIKTAAGGVDEDALLHVRCLRLGWLGLSHLAHLELFSQLTELYLQHNELDDVDGLLACRNLEFLALGWNGIASCHGLRRLRRLLVLDVSGNPIARIEPDDLPPSLRMINVAHTPYAQLPAYRARLLAMLPDCVCIDGVDVTDAERASARTDAGAGAADEPHAGTARDTDARTDEGVGHAAEEVTAVRHSARSDVPAARGAPRDAHAGEARALVAEDEA
ncbi:hypothetical protein EON67_05785, partial [archaeon]